MSVWCLSVHASWTCRHSGACCRAGWAIPIEGPAFETVRLHFSDAGDRLVTGGQLPEGAAAMLATDGRGSCRFHEGRRCGIHRQLGPDALPAACRQFPRQALRDGRGTFISLSHFCPTAARLLFEAVPLAIVHAPPALALDGRLEGLEAAGALPPLLRSDLLMDLDGYAEWERQSVAALASRGRCAEEAIELVAAATAAMTRWRPGRESLAGAVRRAFAEARPTRHEARLEDDIQSFRLAAGAVPGGLTAPRFPGGADPVRARHLLWAHDRAVRAYLAARLFGSWIAYYAGGLLTVVAYLRVCTAILAIEAARQRHEQPSGPGDRLLREAIRQADLLLVHLADARALTRAIEHDPDLRARTLSPLRHHRYPLR